MATPTRAASPHLDQGSIGMALALQRRAGNRAVGHLVANGGGTTVAGLAVPAAGQVQRQGGGSDPAATTSAESSSSSPGRTRYRIRVVGHASPRWRRPGASTQELRNLGLSQERAEAVESALRSMFGAFDEPVTFDLSSGLDDTDDALAVDWRGMGDTLGESDDDRDADDPQGRRVDIAIDLLESATQEGGYTESVTVSDRTDRWAIKVDVLEGAFGAAGSMGQGELRNRETGQSVKGRWIAGGGGGGIDLPIPSVAPGSWTNFRTASPVTFANFDDTPVRLTSIAAGVGIGYGTAEFSFTDLMDAPVTLDGVVFNQWGVGGSVTAGPWDFTRPIPEPPTEAREVTEHYAVTVGSETGHRVLFDTGSGGISSAERERLQAFVDGLPR